MTTYSGDAIFGIIYNQFKDELPKPIWPKKQWRDLQAQADLERCDAQSRSF